MQPCLLLTKKIILGLRGISQEAATKAKLHLAFPDLGGAHCSSACNGSESIDEKCVSVGVSGSITGDGAVGCDCVVA